MIYSNYTKIKECTNFWCWLSCSWCFTNRHGIREWGERFFGWSISNFEEEDTF